MLTGGMGTASDVFAAHTMPPGIQRVYKSLSRRRFRRRTSWFFLELLLNPLVVGEQAIRLPWLFLQVCDGAFLQDLLGSHGKQIQG